MRLSSEQIKRLQTLLKSELGLEYSDEQTQEAGLAILRFVKAKIQRAAKIEAGERAEDDTNNQIGSEERKMSGVSDG